MINIGEQWDQGGHGFSDASHLASIIIHHHPSSSINHQDFISRARFAVSMSTTLCGPGGARWN
jgi:hypothetical protein